MKNKIMIIEDHEEMQLLYKAMFRHEEDIEIVSQLFNAEEAFKKIKQLQPHLVIIDISLPGMSGLELTRIIHSSFPHLKILVVTGHEIQRYSKAVKEAGADELVMKGNALHIVALVKKLLS